MSRVSDAPQGGVKRAHELRIPRPGGSKGKNGEVFKLELLGTERCADLDAFKFNARNSC